MKSPMKNATTKPIIESINEKDVVFSKKLDLKISLNLIVSIVRSPFISHTYD